MSELVKVNAKEYGLEENKAKEIESIYAPMVNVLEMMEESFNELVSQEITGELAIKAKRLRLDIAKVRTTADKARKSAKDEYLRAGNAIQGAYNTLLYAVKSKEEKLLAIENHFAKIETERLEALQDERVVLLSEYLKDAQDRHLSSMSEEKWIDYLSTHKEEYLERVAREEQAEKEAQAKIQALKDEEARLIKANERLKALAAEVENKRLEDEEKRKKEETKRLELEAIKKAEILKQEGERKAKAEAELKKLEDQRKKEQAERDEITRIETEKRKEQNRIERELQEAVLKEEIEARKKIEAELKAKKDKELAEEKAKQDEINRLAELKRIADLAPEKEKINQWVEDFVLLNLIDSDGFSIEGIETCNEVLRKFNEFKEWAKSQAESIK